ncbi:unnamed protein product, partial [Didymodactylos carnosus]
MKRRAAQLSSPSPVTPSHSYNLRRKAGVHLSKNDSASPAHPVAVTHKKLRKKLITSDDESTNNVSSNFAQMSINDDREEHTNYNLRIRISNKRSSLAASDLSDNTDKIKKKKQNVQHTPSLHHEEEENEEIDELNFSTDHAATTPNTNKTRIRSEFKAPKKTAHQQQSLRERLSRTWINRHLVTHSSKLQPSISSTIKKSTINNNKTKSQQQQYQEEFDEEFSDDGSNSDQDNEQQKNSESGSEESENEGDRTWCSSSEEETNLNQSQDEENDDDNTRSSFHSTKSSGSSTKSSSRQQHGERYNSTFQTPICDNLAKKRSDLYRKNEHMPKNRTRLRQRKERHPSLINSNEVDTKGIQKRYCLRQRILKERSLRINNSINHADDDQNRNRIKKQKTKISAELKQRKSTVSDENEPQTSGEEEENENDDTHSLNEEEDDFDLDEIDEEDLEDEGSEEDAVESGSDQQSGSEYEENESNQSNEEDDQEELSDVNEEENEESETEQQQQKKIIPIQIKKKINKVQEMDVHKMSPITEEQYHLPRGIISTIKKPRPPVKTPQLMPTRKQDRNNNDMKFFQKNKIFSEAKKSYYSFVTPKPSNHVDLDDLINRTRIRPLALQQAQQTNLMPEPTGSDGHHSQALDLINYLLQLEQTLATNATTQAATVQQKTKKTTTIIKRKVIQSVISPSSSFTVGIINEQATLLTSQSSCDGSSLLKFLHSDLRREQISELITVHLSSRLVLNTLFLAVNLYDRAVLTGKISTKYYQRNQNPTLLLTCLLIAGKFEEVEWPTIHSLVEDRPGITSDDLKSLEIKLLNSLDFDIGLTVLDFLYRYCETIPLTSAQLRLIFFTLL